MKLGIRSPAAARARAWRAVIAAAAAAALFAAPPAARGQGEDKDEGVFFFGFNAAAGPFRGDFDGGLSLWHFEKVFAVPVLPGDVSLGLSFGRKSATGLWEVVYLQASKNGMWQGRDLGVTLSSLEIRGRAWMFKNSPVRPVFFLGFGFPVLRVAEGARMGGSVETALFTGGQLVLGAGVMAELGPRLFLSAGAGYRALWFLYTFGGGKGRDVSKLTPEYGGEFFGRPLAASRLGLEISLGILL
ncbi:MAG: hypothetical protein FJY83_10575 [Candidatus Aminicenantes bacterium]|nr:hypothetical protein [Candidatus Aminicenantes bacterium]